MKRSNKVSQNNPVVIQMKCSRYNFVFPLEENLYLLYNALSGGSAVVDSHTLDLLAQIGQKESIETNSQVSQVITNLKKGKFILEDNFDEVGYLKVLTHAHRFRSHTLGLTIAPTLECNFACTYCYENHSNVRMNAETITAVNQFLKSETKSATGLSITWFGGEPLTALDIIKDISHSITRLQKEKEFYYQAGIVTNGYLLTDTVAEQLDDLCIKSAQITIDGPQDVHDRRRTLKNGKGTFQTILDNVTRAADILEKISIRVNVDKTNIDGAPELLDVLKEQGLKGKVAVYFSPVLDLGVMCRDVSADCFSYETYSHHEIDLYKKAIEKGFGIARYPEPLYGYCGAVSLKSLLIDPYGNFHKCWNTVGIETEKVGTLGESLPMNSVLVDWLSWDPFTKKECRTCKFFPICMGGCPYLLRTREVNCNTWKYNLEEMLKLHYTSMVQRGT